MKQINVLLLLLALTPMLAADDATDAIRAARMALQKGDAAAALQSANKAVAADPKNALALFLRGEAYAAQRKSPEAIKDYEAAVAIDKSLTLAIDRRGAERFKLGLITESIADFDTFIKAYPSEGPAHWRRGISLYYAAQYDEGAKQFFDGQEKYGADVENVFWHYLCNARKKGVEKARAGLLDLKGPDARVPMMKIDALIRGKATADDVIAAAQAAKLSEEDKNEALFYANLYVGLNYEAEGNLEKAKAHLTTAVEKHKIGHYMWDVGSVHLKLLAKKK